MNYLNTGFTVLLFWHYLQKSRIGSWFHATSINRRSVLGAAPVAIRQGLRRFQDPAARRFKRISMTILRDRYVMLLAVLLALTLGAFFLGILPYPVGILVFGVLLMMRVRSLRGSGKNRGSKQ